MRRLLGAALLALAACGTGGTTGGNDNRPASEVCGDLALPGAAGSAYVRGDNAEATIAGPLSCEAVDPDARPSRGYLCTGAARGGGRPLAVQLFFAGDAGASRPAAGQTLAIGRDVRILGARIDNEDAVFSVLAGADGTLVGTADGATLRGRVCQMAAGGGRFPQYRAAFNDVRLTFR